MAISKDLSKDDDDVFTPDPQPQPREDLPLINQMWNLKPPYMP